MGANTKIEWAHHSVNLWWGCSKVSPACQNCYAELLAKLFSRGKATWGVHGQRWIRDAAAVRELQKLDASAGKRGVRERVFINSMSDTFEDRADLIVPRQFLWDAAESLHNLDLLLLTKRPENVRSMVPCAWLYGAWPSNVWLGTTVEDQQRANQRIPVLLKVPAAVRFLSCEPLLGPIDLGNVDDDEGNTVEALTGIWRIEGRGCSRPGTRIDWIICGSESGAKARPMDPAWPRMLRQQCATEGTAFFMKQMVVGKKVSGQIETFPADLQERRLPEVKAA